MRLTTSAQVGLLTLWLVVPAVRAGIIEKKYPDGTVKIRYDINEVGDRNGKYEEFYPTGKPKVKASYKEDERDGSFQTYHANGKPQVSTTYKAGKLDGFYTEVDVQGAKVVTAVFKEGRLHGPVTRYVKGKAVLTQRFADDVPVYARNLSDIKSKLTAILTGAGPANLPPEADVGLRRLKAYRYLAGLVYENLAVDPAMSAKAQAAAKICDKLGKLDHDPPNPGLPEAEYKVAQEGARTSLLSLGAKDMGHAVDTWIDDSQGSNLESLGHRRWCLNPALQKVGFGFEGKFRAIAAMDASQKKVPDFDFVAYPPPGWVPLEYIGAKQAWSVSLNPKKYKAPDMALQVRVSTVDQLLQRAGEPLGFDHFKVSYQDKSGMPLNCLIFRPMGVELAPGKRYLVEVDGLKLLDGRPAAPIMYLVDFATLE